MHRSEVSHQSVLVDGLDVWERRDVGAEGSTQPCPIGADTECCLQKCLLLDGLERLHLCPAFSKDPNKVSSLVNVNTMTRGDDGSALPAVTLDKELPWAVGTSWTPCMAPRTQLLWGLQGEVDGNALCGAVSAAI